MGVTTLTNFDVDAVLDCVYEPGPVREDAPLATLWIVDGALWVQTPAGPFQVPDCRLANCVAACRKNQGRSFIGELPNISVIHSIIIPPGLYHGKIREGKMWHCQCIRREGAIGHA